MNEKVLIVGATGMLGQPVTRKLKEDGYNITILSSDSARARTIFGDEFEIFDGDVTNPESLKVPLEGKDFLYINLNASLDPVKYQKVEIEGTANLASAAREAGLKRIMNISSAASKGNEIGKIYLDAKVKAEKALIDSGVPYTVMRPSWFFETLPQFVQHGRASILGSQPMKIHWLAATDYASQVSKAFRLEDAANKCFYNLGPEKLTMTEALQTYCDRFYDGMKAKEIPFWIAKLLAFLTR
ncbi:MAG: NAD(P)H-binding protein [candidate division Zixibacteria bacterium]|nr:NAD(P)H-binding protein [candidate division Zixibacteria bacterium]